MQREVIVSYLALAGALGIVPAMTQKETSVASPPAAAITVLPAALAVDRIAEGEARVPVLLTNGGKVPARIWFQAVLSDSEGTRIDVQVHGLWREQTTDWVRPAEVIPLTLRLRPNPPFGSWWDSRLPLRGYLTIVTTTQANPTTEQTIVNREITVPQIQPAGAEVVAILFALVVALGVAMFAARHRGQTAPKGAASWSSDSIASNIALGAGLVAALFALSSLPQLTLFASRASYSLMIGIFGALVALGVPIANLLGKVAGESRWPFVTASVLVLWGATGQLEITALLVGELRHASVIAISTAVLLWTLVVILVVTLALYINHVVTHPEKRAIVRPRIASRRVAADSRTDDRDLEEGWSVP